MNLKYLTDCKLSVDARGIADNIETDFALSRIQSNRSVFRISPACALRKKLCGIRLFAFLGHNLIPRDPQINYFGIFTI